MPSEGPNRREQQPTSIKPQEKAYGTMFVEQVCGRVLELLAKVLPSIKSPNDSRIKRAVKYALDRQVVDGTFTPENPAELRVTPMQAGIRAVIRRAMSQRKKTRTKDLRRASKSTARAKESFLDTEHDQIVDVLVGSEEDQLFEGLNEQDIMMMPLVDDGTDTSQTQFTAEDFENEAPWKLK